MNVGENIGAKLQINQANANKQIAQAMAEERRAMAEAFRQGILGIMNYYRMKDLQADTKMPEEIANTADDPADSQKKWRGGAWTNFPTNCSSP